MPRSPAGIRNALDARSKLCAMYKNSAVFDLFRSFAVLIANESPPHGGFYIRQVLYLRFRKKKTTLEAHCGRCSSSGFLVRKPATSKSLPRDFFWSIARGPHKQTMKRNACDGIVLAGFFNQQDCFIPADSANLKWTGLLVNIHGWISWSFLENHNSNSYYW